MSREDLIVETLRLADRILSPGATVRIFFNEGNRNNKLIHIRGVIDCEYVVYRWWSLSKGWVYEMETLYYFYLLIGQGNLFSKRWRPYKRSDVSE